jgi:hypothetical protein
MKQRILHIALLIALLQMVGCEEKNPSGPKDSVQLINPGNESNERDNGSNNPGKKHVIESRFRENAGANHEYASKEQENQDNDYAYYIPAEDLEKQAMISSQHIDQPMKSWKKSSGFREPYDLQEPDFFRTGRTSQEVFFTAVFDNDIFDYTDYYYTNGIRLEFYHPGISASPLMQLLPGLRNSINYYGLTLSQNLYTPRKLEDENILAGDRPFASYLTLGHQKISLSATSHRRLETELSLGIIGPASLGGVAQDAIHENEPLGWVNQVGNDFVVNYSVRFDQGLYSGRNLELAVIAGGQAGTLYDNLMAGVYLQLGRMNNRYGSVFQTTGHQKPYRNRVRYYFSIDLKNKFIIYDATMQGGMFNQKSVYSLDREQVNHYVFTGTASLGLGLGRYSLEAGQVFLTPEFDGGRHHLWFRIKNIFYLD